MIWELRSDQGDEQISRILACFGYPCESNLDCADNWCVSVQGLVQSQHWVGVDGLSGSLAEASSGGGAAVAASVVVLFEFDAYNVGANGGGGSGACGEEGCLGVESGDGCNGGGGADSQGGASYNFYLHNTSNQSLAYEVLNVCLVGGQVDNGGFGGVGGISANVNIGLGAAGPSGVSGLIYVE